MFVLKGTVRITCQYCMAITGLKSMELHIQSLQTLCCNE